MLRFLSFSLLVTGSLATPRNHGPKGCRCLPTEPCWPSDAEWQSLNETVNGHVTRVTPLGAVCHDTSYDEDACNELLRGGAYNSSLRAEDPGAGQWTNWEAWEEKNQTCYIGTPQDVPCLQGRISPYSVSARSADDIIAAVRFATEHDIRLVVKNTGHDFAGRSLAPHSLQIRTWEMNGISFSEDFVPEGTQEGAGPAVTVEARVQLFELYRFCHERNVTVIAGFSSTVGAAGGYIQSGGHSILSPWKGLASDHVLQYTVVTADGAHVTANAYQNRDLFWALRGGGGGTFGVVTSVTLAAHPNPPLTHFTLDIVRPTADGAFWTLIERLYEHIPSLNDLGVSLSTVAYPQTTIPSPADGEPEALRALLTLRGFVVGEETTSLRSALTELEDSWRAGSKNATLSAPTNLRFNVTTSPSITSFYIHTLTGQDMGGASTVVGSRLVSRAFISSPHGPSSIADVFSKIQLSPDEAVSGNMIGGGAVAENRESVDSAVHPAWRTALLHMMIVRGWAPGTPKSRQRDIQEEVTRVQVPLLKGLVLDGEVMGAYLNEADGAEPEFQEAFWGSNYGRLLEVKRRWDPKGVFIVRRGVGSEEWDEEGMCRGA